MISPNDLHETIGSFGHTTQMPHGREKEIGLTAIFRQARKEG